MTDPVLGIDLGSTSAKVAVAERGRPRLIRIDGVPLMPAVVALGGDGRPWVGYPAYRQMKMDPDSGVRAVKRRLGEEVALSLGGFACSPQEIAALILGRLRQVAAETLGQPVSRAVIAVPACYSDAQRRAIRSAGELAGLQVLRLVNEPAAAALARAVSEPASRNLLVYDLGGGCFDVAVVRRGPGRVEVLATQGDARLGGDDLDAHLMAHAVAHLQAHQEIDPRDHPEAMARIRQGCEAARIALSETDSTWIEVTDLRAPDGRPLQWSLPLTRATCDALLAEAIEPTLAAVTAVLGTAGLACTELDEALVLGGASRSPLVQQRLERLLGLGPCAGVDPELSVVAGAALLGAALDGQPGLPQLVDVTGHTLGTSALGDRGGEPYLYTYVPLIQRNTAIPVARSEAFSTVDDGQSAIDVHIYQGENADALKNTEIGAFRIEGLSDVPAGNILVMTFRLDADGLLEVTAREQQTGLVKQVSIDNASSRFAGVGRADARRRLAALLAGRAIDEIEPEPEPAQASAPGPAAAPTSAPALESAPAPTSASRQPAAPTIASGSAPAPAAASRQQAEPTAARGSASASAPVPAPVSDTAPPAADGTPAPAMLQRVIDKAERLLAGANDEDRADLSSLLAAVRNARAQGDVTALERASAALTDLVYFLET